MVKNSATPMDKKRSREDYQSCEKWDPPFSMSKNISKSMCLSNPASFLFIPEEKAVNNL